MKPWYRSKTMIVNLAALIALVLGSTEIQALIPESGWSYIVQAQAILNIVLRLFTNTGVTGGGTK